MHASASVYVCVAEVGGGWVEGALDFNVPSTTYTESTRGENRRVDKVTVLRQDFRFIRYAVILNN